MPLQALPSTSVSEASGSRGVKHARTEGNDEEEKKLARLTKGELRVLAKGLSKALQAIRGLEAAVYLVAVLNADGPFTGMLLDVHRQYGLACEQAGKGHTLGPPFPHLWKEFLTLLCASSKILPDHLTCLTAAASAATNFELEDFRNQVTEIRVEKMFDNKKKRLALCITDPNISNAVRTTLRAEGANILTGHAPPGALEKLSQKLISDN